MAYSYPSAGDFRLKASKLTVLEVHFKKELGEVTKKIKELESVLKRKKISLMS